MFLRVFVLYPNCNPTKRPVGMNPDIISGFQTFIKAAHVTRRQWIRLDWTKEDTNLLNLPISANFCKSGLHKSNWRLFRNPSWSQSMRLLKNSVNLTRQTNRIQNMNKCNSYCGITFTNCSILTHANQKIKRWLLSYRWNHNFPDKELIFTKNTQLRTEMLHVPSTY